MGGKKFHGTYPEAMKAISPTVTEELFKPEDNDPKTAIGRDLPQANFVISAKKKRTDFEGAWRDKAKDQVNYVQGDMSGGSISMHFGQLLSQLANKNLLEKWGLSNLGDEPYRCLTSVEKGGFLVNVSFAYCDDEGNYCGFSLETLTNNPNYWEVAIIRKTTDLRENREVTILLNLGKQDVSEDIFKSSEKMGPIQEELKTALNSAVMVELLSPLFKEQGFINTDACVQLQRQISVKRYLDTRLNRLLEILQQAQKKVGHEHENTELINELGNKIASEQESAEKNLFQYLESLDEDSIKLELAGFYKRVQGLKNVENIVERSAKVDLDQKDFLSEGEKEFLNRSLFEVIINPQLSFTDKYIDSMKLADSPLGRQLVQIKQTVTEDSRKNLLYQLALDLHQLDRLDSFYEIFCNESDEFLKSFHLTLSTLKDEKTLNASLTAMNYLLSLNLQNQNTRELAYSLAFKDTPEANQFRETLSYFEKNKNKIDEDMQRNIIETLCLIQNNFSENKEKKPRKNIFQLFNNTNTEEDKNQAFKLRKSIRLIEESCHNIRTRLQKEAPSSNKLSQFIAEEQKYRQQLYTLAFDAITTKMRPQKFAERIKASSKEMLEVVDEDRHPWCRGALFALANLLGSCLLMIPNIVKGVTSKISGAKALFFYSTTQSGKEIRELNNDLTDTLSTRVIK
ncbi:Uncharacterised protein [Legionella busanensis]|uniref:Uncharacterized protein n=1 Tax=Legionella busanensis TaxID=190655 RepID=A0A378JNC7_9GAMM|nr:hypothetical protein [Legionella busanensis]STX52221.1 Uncharacterised protein [Legionella busanensis]